MEKPVVFSKHAEYKLQLLREHGFEFSKKEVEEIVKNPEQISAGYVGRKIAARVVSKQHVVRVVFEDLPRQLKIITMDPSRRGRYED